VAGFVLWNVQPGFMFRNAFLSLRNLKEGRVHVLITSAFSQACVCARHTVFPDLSTISMMCLERVGQLITYSLLLPDRRQERPSRFVDDPDHLTSPFRHALGRGKVPWNPVIAICKLGVRSRTRCPCWVASQGRSMPRLCKTSRPYQSA